MIKERLLKKLAVSIVVLALINAVAGFLHLYDLVWWFDMPMHFLGGVSVFYLSTVVWLPARKWVSNGRFIYEGIITALFLGVLWEALELYLHIHYGSPAFVLTDSLSDLCFDLAGACIAAMSTLRVIKNTPDPLLRNDGGMLG